MVLQLKDLFYHILIVNYSSGSYWQTYFLRLKDYMLDKNSEVFINIPIDNYHNAISNVVEQHWLIFYL